jgi:hypothetical protein
VPGRPGCHPDHAVDVVGDDIDLAVTHADVQLDLRVARLEIRQRRHQPQPRVRPGHIHAQAPARLAGRVAQPALHLFQLGQQAGDARVVGRAVGGDADPARGAVEQAQPQVRLQLLHQLGDRGAADLQGLRGAGEAAGFHHPGKGPHRLETVHGGP